MNCINRDELEQFLGGKLAPERLVAVDLHVRGCSECRAALCGLPERGRIGADLCSSLLGVSDCPDYEELSAFVDNALESDRAKALQVHANVCEYCASDIAAMRESRSHALLVDKVTVRPGAIRARAASPLVFWKRALAGASVAAVALAVALTVGPFGSAPKSGQWTAAIAPTVTGKPGAARPTGTAHAPNKPEIIVEQPETPSTPLALAYTVALRDGGYQVIKKNGRLLLTRANGQPVTQSMGTELAASVDEKLQTGRTKPVGPILTAIVAITVRGVESSYTPPPSAPKLVSPLGRVILSDGPTFEWTPVDLADSYRLRITDEHGNVVAEEMATSNSLTLVKPLRRGQVYTWRVGSKFAESDSWAESAAGKFHVLSADDYASIQRVKHALPGSHLALGAAYERLGLTDEATREYRALRRQNPSSPLAKELLHKTVLK